MKISRLLVWLSLPLTSVAGFSAVAPKSGSSPQPVDRSVSLDEDVDVFDPTEGENPAVVRNNKGDVWVPQVRERRVSQAVS